MIFWLDAVTTVFYTKKQRDQIAHTVLEVRPRTR